VTLPFGSEAGLALELLATVLGRGAALVATAWLATRLVGSAEIRRSAWIALFVALAAAPLLVLGPAWIAMPVGEDPVAATGVEASVGVPAPAPDRTPLADPGASTATVPFDPAPAAGPGDGSPLPRAVILVWLLGTVAFLLRMAAGRYGLARIASRGRRPGARLAGIARAEIERAGIERRVRVILTGDFVVPASWGDRRPVVAFPADADRWPTDRARIVLRHELAHVRGRDALALALARAARAFYWPNPLVWWALGRARDAQEEACDEVVLATGVRGVDYARHLVDVARACADRGRAVPEGAVTIGALDRLERRVRSILSRRPVARRRGLAVGVAAALVLVAAPVAGVRLEPVHDRVVETALDHLASSNPVERRRAAVRLAEIADRRTRPALEARLADPDPAVRRAAAAGLGRLADPASVRPILAALGDDDRDVREHAIVALGALADRRAFYDLEPIALGDDPDLAPAAIWALGEIRCFPGLGVLGDVLAGDSDPRARATAARGLRDAPAALAAPPLASALRGDPDPAVRLEAATALGRLAFGEEAFRRALSREASTIRRRDAHLVDESGPDAALAALRNAARDPDPRVRSAAAQAVDAIESRTG